MKLRIALLLVAVCYGAVTVVAQRAHSVSPPDSEFGPVVRAYLGYLRAEQEVVDARESRREISGAYYRRNSSRIRALRQIAVRLARESRNDYLPELEAVASDELGTLFETPPAPHTFHVGAILDNTFRYLGAVREGEIFYLFVRLNPYEQADLMQQSAPGLTAGPSASKAAASNSVADTVNSTHGAAPARPRRISPP